MSLCSTRGTTLRYKPLRYAVINRTLITRVRAGEVGVAQYPKWRRSLLIRAETRDFHLRHGMGARTIAWGRCTPLTIVDQFGIKIRGFTLSCEALVARWGHYMNGEISRNSEIELLPKQRNRQALLYFCRAQEEGVATRRRYID